MSQELPDKNTDLHQKESNINKSEEVDLLVLFTIIGNTFSKFFNFINSTFKFFLGVIMLLLKIIIKHYIVISVLMILTVAGLFFLKKNSEPLYVSNLIIRQNYNSGDLLYYNIKKFNELSLTRSYEDLAKEFNVSRDKVESLREFKVKHTMSSSELMDKYSLYLKELKDSTDSLSFKEYRETYDYQNYPFQTIRVVSSDKDIFNLIEKNLVDKIASNEFFIKEREIQLGVLNDKLNKYRSSVRESKILQDKYIGILEKHNDLDNKSGSATDINLNINKGNNRNEFPLTKEYELFLNSQKLDVIIAKTQDTIRMKDDIIRVQKPFGIPALEKNTIKSNFLIILISVFMLIVIVLVFKEMDVIAYIKNYQVKKFE